MKIKKKNKKKKEFDPPSVATADDYQEIDVTVIRVDVPPPISIRVRQATW